MKILIIDNCSTDNTLEIARALAAKDERIRVISFNENIGGEGNFSRCIELTKEDYTAIFHSDDIYDPTIIEKYVDTFVKYPELGAVFSNGIRINENDTSLGVLYNYKKILPKKEIPVYGFAEIFKAILRYSNFFICPSAMVRTSIYKNEIKKWDAQGFFTSADLSVWLRILQNHSVAILDEALIRVRESDSSFTFRARFKRVDSYDMFKVLDYYLLGFAKPFVSENDIGHYEFLKRKCNYVLARNNLIAGNVSEAREFLGVPITFTDLMSVKDVSDLIVIIKRLGLSVMTIIPNSTTILRFLLNLKS